MFWENQDIVGFLAYVEEDVVEILMETGIDQDKAEKIVRRKEILYWINYFKEKISDKTEDLESDKKRIELLQEFIKSPEGAIVKEYCEGNKKRLPELREMIKANNVFDMHIPAGDEGYISIFYDNCSLARLRYCEGIFDVEEDLEIARGNLERGKLRIKCYEEELADCEKELAEINGYLGKEM